MQEQIKLKLRTIEKLLLHKVVLPAVYEVHRNKPIAQKLVLFADSKNKNIPFSMQAMYEEMINRGYQVENWCVDFGELTLTQKLNYLFRFMKRYSQAKYVFICDYFLPISSCNKKQETQVTHLWHACGLLKKFGYDSFDDLASQKQYNATKNINLWTVSSDACVQIFEKATNLHDGEIQALGVSRTDFYFSKDYKENCEKEFYEKYPELKGTKLILWMPTFRNNATNAELYGFESIMNLQQNIHNVHVLVKLHPHLAKKYQLDNCEIPAEKLYPVVDLLITDYSSALFDYYILKKPFLIFAPDYNEFMSRRGCYIDMEKELPCKITRNQEELELYVQESLETKTSYSEEFWNKHLGKCDGHSIERIVNYLNL